MKLQKGNVCVPKTSKIARDLNLPTTTVHNRIKRMQKNGVLTGIYGLVAGDKVNRGQIVYAVVKVIYESRYTGKKVMRDFGKKLSAIEEVQEVHICSGDWDYLIKVKAKDAKDYYRVTSTKILPLGGIEKLEGFVVLDTQKETPTIEL